jgi:hypothetical protein
MVEASKNFKSVWSILTPSRITPPTQRSSYACYYVSQHASGNQSTQDQGGRVVCTWRACIVPRNGPAVWASNRPLYIPSVLSNYTSYHLIFQPDRAECNQVDRVVRSKERADSWKIWRPSKRRSRTPLPPPRPASTRPGPPPARRFVLRAHG